MKFMRRLVTQADAQSMQANRVLSVNPSLKAAAVDEFTRTRLRLLVTVLGEEFAAYVLAACSNRDHLYQVLERAWVTVELFMQEFEEDQTTDLQVTMAVVVIKRLFPFNVKKIQSRSLEVRRFLRDFEGWPLEFRQYLEELLIVDRQLDNRTTIYMFTYAA